jgi:hypothetical protein
MSEAEDEEVKAGDAGVAAGEVTALPLPLPLPPADPAAAGAVVDAAPPTAAAAGEGEGEGEGEIDTDSESDAPAASTGVEGAPDTGTEVARPSSGGPLALMSCSCCASEETRRVSDHRVGGTRRGEAAG